MTELPPRGKGSNPRKCSPPGSSHGALARVLGPGRASQSTPTPPLPKREKRARIGTQHLQQTQQCLGHDTQSWRGDAEIPARPLCPRHLLILLPKPGRSLKDSPAQKQALGILQLAQEGTLGLCQGSEHPAPTSKPKPEGFPSPTSAHNHPRLPVALSTSDQTLPSPAAFGELPGRVPSSTLVPSNSNTCDAARCPWREWGPGGYKSSLFPPTPFMFPQRLYQKTHLS